MDLKLKFLSNMEQKIILGETMVKSANFKLSLSHLSASYAM